MKEGPGIIMAASRVGLVVPAVIPLDWSDLSSEAIWRLSGENLGNHAFIESVARSTLVSPIRVPYDADPVAVRDNLDVLLLPAANWVSSSVDLGLLPRLVQDAGLPTLVVGLGLQSEEGERVASLSRDSVTLLDAVATNAPPGARPLLLRGWETASTLDRLGVDGWEVTGCPSNWLNHSGKLGRRLRSRIDQLPALPRTAFVAGNPALPLQRSWNQQAYRVLSDNPDAMLVVQEDWGLLALSRGDSIAAPWLQALADAFGPVSSEDFRDLMRRQAFGSPDVEAWRDQLRAFDLVVGTRIHGASMAIQAGVPGVLLWHDSRTKELAQAMLLPAASLEEADTTRDGWARHILDAFDPVAFDNRRRELVSRFVEVLRSFGVPPAEGIIALLSDEES